MRGYDGLVTARFRRPARPRLLGLAVAIALVLAACHPDVTDTPRPGSPAPSRRPPPDLTAVPGGPASPVIAATVGPPSTTQTEFGTIYDALPASWPKLPGEEPAETGDGPTSGSFALNMSAAAASHAMQAALIAAGWTADIGSPLEDGSVVLEAARSGGCKAEVRFTPRSGTVLMSVLYGSRCPFG